MSLRKGWMAFGLSLCVGALIALVPTTKAIENTNWLLAKEITTQKTQELAPNLEPMSLGYDCDGVVELGYTRKCLYNTALGTATAKGYVAADGLAVNVANGFEVLPPIPGRPNTLVFSLYSKSKSQFNTYTEEYSVANLTTQNIWDPVAYKSVKSYLYTPKALKVLLGPGDVPFSYTPNMFSYSANGRWAVGSVRAYPDEVVGSLVVFDLTNPLIKPRVISVSPGLNFYPFSTIKSSNLAISNDGRYVAINGYDPGYPTKPTLRLYDTTTCLDQLGKTYANNCEYKDIWKGTFRSGAYTSSVPSVSRVEYPRHLRFNSDNTLSFQGIYGRTAATTFSVAEFVATTTSTGEAPISVLGMGDSYISGEGAFQYRNGTDTANNKCHTSLLSYPLQLGNKLFPSEIVKTVACSGAKIDDIINNDDNYGGQTIPKTEWQLRSEATRSWSQQYNFPGYTYQQYFAEEYNPRNILLSIGGNDIHFADILTQCVNPRNQETCYKTKQSREQIMKLVIKTYPELVTLYKDLLTESGGKVYVIAYPQIANPNGSCRMNVKLNADELKFGSQLISYLNSIIKKATLEAGVQYVDTENAFAGYRLCEAPKGKSAVNGFTFGKDNGATVAGKKFYFIGNESYHPTQLGHELLEKKILQTTNNLTTPMPRPTSQAKPVFDPNHELIRGAEDSSESVAQLTWIGYTDSLRILYKGSTYVLPTNKLPQYFKVGTHIKAYLHSTPVLLYEGDFNENKKILLQIPETTPPGVHSLDIYGVDANGVERNVRQLVYVAHNEADYDGDGVPNEASPCLFMPAADADEDSDGIDDGCDGVIGAVGAENTNLPANDSTPPAPEDVVPSYQDDEAALSLEKWVEPTPEPLVQAPTPTTNPIKPMTNPAHTITPLQLVNTDAIRIEHYVSFANKPTTATSFGRVLGELSAHNRAPSTHRPPSLTSSSAPTVSKVVTTSPQNNTQSTYWRAIGILGMLGVFMLVFAVKRRQKRKHFISL